MEDFDTLRAQLDALLAKENGVREALVWYSNPSNWNRDNDTGRCWRQSAAMEDAGKRARAALGIGIE
jgi:hypothetical protein